MWKPWATRFSAAIGIMLLSQLLLLWSLRFLTADHRDVRLFISGFAVAFLLFAMAAFLVIRSQAPTQWLKHGVIWSALPIKLVMLFQSPVSTNDYWRYLWDGRVIASGINPFLYAPSSEALSHLRDLVVFPQIGLPDLPTVYPPLSQGFFYLSHLIAPDSLLLVKVGLLLSEVAAGFLLIPVLQSAGRSLAWLAVYAWHPLLSLEIASAGHVDALALPLVVLGLLAAIKSRPAWAGAFVAGAALVKLYPAAILPALWRWGDWRLPTAFVAVLLLGYRPFAGAGLIHWRDGSVLGSLFAVSGSHFNQGLIWSALGRVGRVLGSPQFANVIVLGMLVSAVGWVLRQSLRPDASEPSVTAKWAVIIAGIYLLVSPTVHPWYLLFVLPLLAVWPVPWVFAFSGMVVLSYMNYHIFPWHMPAWVRLAEYLPIYLLAGYSLVHAYRCRQTTTEELAQVERSGGGG